MTPAASAAATTPATKTADNTLQPKGRDAGVVSGGRRVAKALKNEGVDTIFTLGGGHIIDIYDGCIDEGIRIIDVRHEQVAAHAADGYARQTGKLGCVVSTAGPGCTNAMTRIAPAFRSESPERVAAMISMAAREAFDGAPGPVYLEMPRDIDKLADMVVNSERPAILYGQQVWAARGHEKAIALLRGLDIPAYFNGGSRGLLPPGDPHHFDRTRGNAFSGADVIGIVGAPFDFRMGCGRRISTKLKLVQIDIDYRTAGKNRDIDLGLVGDPGAILGAVLQAASGRIKQDKRQARRQWLKKLTDAEAAAAEKLMPLFKSNTIPIHPYRVAYELNEFLANNTIYIGDGGDVVDLGAVRTRLAACARIGAPPGPLGSHRYMGGPAGIRAGNEKSDHVQIRPARRLGWGRH